jgi:heme/copper-type cytochrome/quinol oxidase subunit 2
MRPILRPVLALLCISLGLGSAAAKPRPAKSPQAKPASVASPVSKVKNITIVAIEGKLSPDIVRVRRGDLVRLTFKVKDGTYGVKIPALNVKGKATPERPVYVEFAATSEGEYEIRCTKFWGIKHWSENGKIVVE